jgi:outer membrane immunogenic protein
MSKALCASTVTLAWLLAAAPLAPGYATDLGVAPIYQSPAPVTNWTGSYFGVSGGGAWGSAVVRHDVTGVDQVPGLDATGGMRGASTGFNFQNGSLVLGYEGDTSITGRHPAAFEFPAGPGFKDDIKERWLSTFRGRVGYAQDNWLIYATAGGALANLGHAVIGAEIAERHWHWGVAAGAGVEVRFTSDWSAKVEYLYVGLQDKSYFSPAPSGAFTNQRVNLDDHILRVGVNYKLPWSVLDSFFNR